jgi:hypothetical protein
MRHVVVNWQVLKSLAPCRSTLKNFRWALANTLFGNLILETASRMTKQARLEVSLSALCQANWFWQYFDALELHRIQVSNGRLSASSAKRIADEYRVTRTLPANTYGLIANEINKLALSFESSNLTVRAGLCLKTAKKLHHKNIPKSATSKLVWFIAPRGWTMYDKFAAKGVGIKNTIDPSSFICFYAALDAAGFTMVLEEVRNVLNHNGLADLLAERIVDWLLMGRGRRRKQSEVDGWVAAYLSTRSPLESKALMRTAAKLAGPLASFRPLVQ